MSREEQAQYISEKLMEDPEFKKAFVGAITDAVNEVVKVIKALQHEPCEMTAEEYRQRMIQAFHNADCDELIALVVLPTEKEFEHLGWLLEKHYKAKPEPCTDAISRQAVKDVIFAEPLYKSGMKKRYGGEAVPAIFEKIKALPSVTPKFTDIDIQKMQEMELAEIQEAYELGKAEMQPSEDCISRQVAIDEIINLWADKPFGNPALVEIKGCIEKLSPVTPQQKMGKWIRVDKDKCKCDQCEVISFIAMYPNGDKNYCPNCGAKMGGEQYGSN